jgi:endonuclease/exonuclease/phosphatase family metal-dependent hydrolase
MKQILVALVLVAQAVFMQFARSGEEQNIRVMTFNIRYGTAPDGENAWPNRKDIVLAVIRDFNPDLLGLQECMRDQLDTILTTFPAYSAVGVGREADGAGEYSPLLYNRNRFDVLKAETFWLSDTPDVRASKSWGNAITRICTWAELLDRSNNHVIRVCNTHWDHQSQPARIKSGELMAKRLLSADNLQPTIVTGDFNVGPVGPARQPLIDAGLRDSFVDAYPDQARQGTFHEFKGKSYSDKIDAILVSRQWDTASAEIITTNQEGRFPSDHFPVTATLKLKAVNQ